MFEADVQPLLVSDYEFVRENFYPADNAVVHGKMLDNSDWDHPSGSNLIGWTKEYVNSRIVYLQYGDDPVA